jgi:hypothetical protein
MASPAGMMDCYDLNEYYTIFGRAVQSESNPVSFKKKRHTNMCIANSLARGRYM